MPPVAEKTKRIKRTMLNLQNTVLVFLFSFSCLLYKAVWVDLQLLDANGLKTLPSKMHADVSPPKNLDTLTSSCAPYSELAVLSCSLSPVNGCSSGSTATLWHTSETVISDIFMSQCWEPSMWAAESILNCLPLATDMRRLPSIMQAQGIAEGTTV